MIKFGINENLFADPEHLKLEENFIHIQQIHQFINELLIYSIKTSESLYQTLNRITR